MARNPLHDPVVGDWFHPVDGYDRAIIGFEPGYVVWLNCRGRVQYTSWSRWKAWVRRNSSMRVERSCYGCDLQNPDYYMLKEGVWLAAAKTEEVLCISCVEQRLGRELTREDFTDAPVNDLNGPFSFHSDRLVARLSTSCQIREAAEEDVLVEQPIPMLEIAGFNEAAQPKQCEVGSES